MHELIEASLRFPTVIFTIGLGIALVYWLFVMLGALDLDLLGGGDASGAAKGIGDAVGGAKGAGDAIKPDGGDADGGVFKFLGLAGVPVTISVSVIFLLGWVLSLLAMHYGADALGTMGGWLSPLVLLVVIVLGVPIAGLLVRPLAPMFEFKAGKSNQDYVGATCTITTGHVDDEFGQATIEDGGTVLVIPVRCDSKGALTRGARALVIEFDPARQAYVVEPADVFAAQKESDR